MQLRPSDGDTMVVQLAAEVVKVARAAGTEVEALMEREQEKA